MLRVGKSDISPRTRPGRNPSTGMLWRMSSIGRSTRSAARDLAAAQRKANGLHDRVTCDPMTGTEHSEAVEALVDLGGVRLHTRRVGTDPPVVVLHGGPGADYAYLLPQYDRLAHRRALRFYDQRGGGRSPVPRDVAVGWQEHVADLEALRKHWAIDRVTLLGYSWGGLLAVLYALEHPDRVGRLALVAPAPLTARWRDEFERRLSARLSDPRIVQARAELSASGLAQRDPEKYRRLAFALSVAGYFKDPSRAKELTPFRVTARTQQAVWQSLGTYDLRDPLRC